MMILRSMQTIEVEPARQDTEHGAVPILGEKLTVTRAWLQCDRCGIIALIDQLASPMLPPPCPQGCDTEPVT